MSSKQVDKKFRLSDERNRALTKKLIDMGLSFQDWIEGHVSILLDGEVSPGVTTAQAIVEKPQVERQHRGPISKAMQVGKEKKRDG